MAVEHGYITLAEVKADSDLTRAAHDPAFERAIEAASRAIEDVTDRRFWRDESPSARVYRVRSWEHVDVDDFDPGELVVVKTDDNDDGTFETTWDLTDLQFEPLNAEANGRAVETLCAVGVRQFPRCGRRPQVQVTATWGWPTVPKQIEMACQLITLRLFMRKDAPFGVIGGTPEMAAVKITRDTDVAALLDPFRKSTGFG